MDKRLIIPGGTGIRGRVIAIGDVHGQADMFEDALNSVQDPGSATLVLTGDLIDRGPDSRRVLSLARRAEDVFCRTILLPGNHEQMLWFASRPDGSSLSWRDVFLMNGGDKTLWEFGNDVNELLNAIPAQMRERLRKRLPCWHREGGILFVHAGLNPRLDPEEFLKDVQDHRTSPANFSEDLSPLWIRAAFYASHGHSGPYAAPGGDEVVVVYGHTRVGESGMSDHLMRVDEDLAEWRIPLDATGSGFLPVMEMDGEMVRMRLVPSPQLGNKMSLSGA